MDCHVHKTLGSRSVRVDLRTSETLFRCCTFPGGGMYMVFSHLLEVLGSARNGSCVVRIVNDYEPLFFRSSALATLAALTRGASVASGSAVCMKAC